MEGYGCVKRSGKPGNANLPIGELDLNGEEAKGKTASAETGVPGWREKMPIWRLAFPGEKKTAGAETGVSGQDPGFKEWGSRGYLPHYDTGIAIQHVTFHLADSLPIKVLERLEIELKALPEEKQEVERRKRLDSWLDAGHGCCVLQEPTIAQMVEDSLLFFDTQRYRMLAWVVMPNHVHTLFQPINGWSVAETVASWKKFTAREIQRYLKNKRPGNANLPIGELDLDGEGAKEKMPIWRLAFPGEEKTAGAETGVPRGFPEKKIRSLIFVQQKLFLPRSHFYDVFGKGDQF